MPPFLPADRQVRHDKLGSKFPLPLVIPTLGGIYTEQEMHTKKIIYIYPAQIFKDHFKNICYEFTPHLY